MSKTMTLATQREGQARMMTIAGGADADRGHWYSPQFVNEYTERLRAENDALRAEVERLAARMQWQPIETAPKDETDIFVTDGKAYAVVQYNGYRFMEAGTDAWGGYCEGYPPTHWMLPIPPPPAERGEG